MPAMLGDSAGIWQELSQHWHHIQGLSSPFVISVHVMVLTICWCAQFWETMLAHGKNTVNIGAIFKGSGPQNFYPRTITINGQPCHIQQMR